MVKNHRSVRRIRGDPLYSYVSSESQNERQKRKGYGGFYGTSKFTFYREWRTAQAEAQNWMRKYYELELALKDAEHNRCDRPDSECSRRTPPRRPITINNQNKEESYE